jgi:hypothetical protein
VVERTFGWLVRNRRLARDYERLTATSEAMIKAAMIRLMLVRLAGQSPRWSHEPHRKTARTDRRGANRSVVNRPPTASQSDTR